MHRPSYLFLALLIAAAAVLGIAHNRFTRLNRAVNYNLGNKTDLWFEPAYDPPFLKRVMFPPDLLQLTQDHRRQALSGAKLVGRYGAVIHGDRDLVIKRGLAVLEALASASPIVWTASETFDICAATPDKKRCRDFARTLALIGHYLIAKRRTAEGVDLLRSVAYIGPAICLDCPGRVTLVPQMVARAIVGIAADGFMLASPDLRPNRDQAKAIGATLLHAISLLPPISHSCRLERRFIPSFPAAYRKQAGTPPAAESLQRAEAFDRVVARAEPHLEHLIDPWIPLMDLPWNEGWPKISEVDKANERYLHDAVSPAGPWSYLQRFIDPYEAVADILLSVAIPTVGKVYKGIWQIHQRVEAARTVLALEAFRREKNRLPGTLAELASWWEAPLGVDYFTGRPLLYDPRLPSLSSVGGDQKAGTSDDLRFLPLTDLVK